MTFIAFRILLTCSVFLGVLAAYGALHSALGGIAALLVVTWMGLAHAAPMVALTSRMKSESGFALVFRLGLLPMILFSGAFFPITQLPTALTWLAYLTPIWHGVDLARQLTLGTAELASGARPPGLHLGLPAGRVVPRDHRLREAAVVMSGATS